LSPPIHLTSSPSSSSPSSTHLLVHHSLILTAGRLGRTHLPLALLTSLSLPRIDNFPHYTRTLSMIVKPNLLGITLAHQSRHTFLSPLIALRPSSPHRQPSQVPRPCQGPPQCFLAPSHRSHDLFHITSTRGISKGTNSIERRTSVNSFHSLSSLAEGTNGSQISQSECTIVFVTWRGGVSGMRRNHGSSVRLSISSAPLASFPPHLNCH
jgi:hypothetical protein